MGALSDTQSMWHAGEKTIQRGAGVAEKMEVVGRRNVRDAMLEQHRAFFAQLPFVVVGSVDAGGAPWATILTGKPGFVVASTPTTLDIAAPPAVGDPAGVGLREGEAVGLLGIELDTRRRNRANGTLRAAAPGRMRVDVAQSFGNCPQYIQLRDPVPVDQRDPPAAAEELDGLDDAARAAIAAADTFFVASYAEFDGRRQVDVSHRGGKSGFVRVGADGTLTIPDFAGNLFFMTLGNVLLSGKAGLAFPDWETGDLLQVTGEAAMIEASPEVAAFAGAERLWTLHPRRVVRRRRALPVRWAMREDGWSPNTLMTGDWREAAGRIEAAARAERWRPFTVASIVDESRSIRSFQLMPADGVGLVPALAGQHLTLRLGLPGAPTPDVRSYTISNAPARSAYRISVKRDGVVSRHLHDHVGIGDTIEVRAPAGAFTIDARAARPAVLLAGGIGITPLLAMLHHLVGEGLRTRTFRPTTLFYAAHRKSDRAFDGEIARLVEQGKNSVRVIRVLGQADGASEGNDFEAVGRIDMPLIARHLAFGDYDFYLCGPQSFTQGLYDGLHRLNVADERIHTESFGPSALVRSGSAGVAPPALAPAATGLVRVAFSETAKEAQWTPASGSLLEFAEAEGLEPAYGCRSGACGSCKTRLITGAVSYFTAPTAARADDEVLICCAVPAEGADEVRLAI